MASTIAFPSTEPRLQLNKSDASLVSRHTTAIEVCNLVYGHADPKSWETLFMLYEADAGRSSFMELLQSSYLYAPQQCKPLYLHFVQTLT